MIETKMSCCNLQDISDKLIQVRENIYDTKGTLTGLIGEMKTADENRQKEIKKPWQM